MMKILFLIKGRSIGFSIYGKMRSFRSLKDAEDSKVK